MPRAVGGFLNGLNGPVLRRTENYKVTRAFCASLMVRRQRYIVREHVSKPAANRRRNHREMRLVLEHVKRQPQVRVTTILQLTRHHPRVGDHLRIILLLRIFLEPADGQEEVDIEVIGAVGVRGLVVEKRLLIPEERGAASYITLESPVRLNNAYSVKRPPRESPTSVESSFIAG